ncbi:MAG: GtrA family protein [Actinobacteria bacterium]|nr:GtrA family protein [Actinomycetota bacterium]
MALVTNRIGAALWRKARSNVGIRFTRFTVVAVASVVASQIALSLLLGPGHQTAGFSGGLAAVIGAGVSYVLSRWAWERKGRPNLLKETLPFWLVSVAVWILLALAAKLGVHLAQVNDMHGAERIAVADGTYFLANCVTFLLRFLLFHYVLFADPKSPRETAVGDGPKSTALAADAATAPNDPAAPDASPEPLADVTPDRRP